nr:E3 ubiquitin-protein ligase MARCH8-like [Ipomoea batatas]
MSSSKMVECRICHDEGLDSTMETPCSCRGTLKYAHRACLQSWCNEKGNTMCEICNQVIKFFSFFFVRPRGILNRL